MNDWNDSNNNGTDQNDWGAPDPVPSDDWGPADDFQSDAGGIGIGAYQPEIGDVVDNAQTLGKRIMGPILVAWVLVAVIQLGFVIVNVAAMGILGAGSLPFILVSIPVWILIGVFLNAFRVSLYKPMRDVMTDGPQAYPDLASLKAPVMRNFLNVLLTNVLVGLVVGFGLVLCIIPGVIAAVLLAMAPYYASTGTPAVDAMRESFETVQRHLGVVIMAFAAVVGIAMLIGFMSMALGMGAGAIMGEYAYIGSSFAEWLIQVAVGVVIWVIMGATYITIDLADSGEGVAM